MVNETNQTPEENAQSDTKKQSIPPFGPKSFPRFLIFGLLIMTGIVFSALYAEDIITMIVGEERIAAIKEAREKKRRGLDTIPQVIEVPPPDDRLTIREGMVTWLRAETISVLSKGNGVTVVPDCSGLENHGIQAKRKTQPKLVMNALNGHPVMRFDGVDDHIKVGDLGDSSTMVTVAAVWAKPKQGGNPYQRLYSSGAGGADYVVKGVFYVPKTGDFGVSAQPPRIRLQRPRNPKDARNFVIGTLNIEADPPQYFLGDLAELIVYNRRLDNEEAKVLRAYLKEKYSIQ